MIIRNIVTSINCNRSLYHQTRYLYLNLINSHSCKANKEYRSKVTTLINLGNYSKLSSLNNNLYDKSNHYTSTIL